MTKTLQIAVVLGLIAIGFFGIMLITRAMAQQQLQQEQRAQPATQR